MGVVENYLWVFLVFTFMVLFHELGHWLVLKLYKVKRIKVEAFKIHYWSNLNNKQISQVILGGIVLGLLPMFLLQGFHFIVGLLLLTAYVGLCRRDLKRLKELH